MDIIVNDNVPAPVVLDNVVFAHETASVARPLHLEVIRDTLAAQRQAEQPYDCDRPLAHWMPDFAGGRLALRLLDADGPGPAVRLTRHAALQAAQYLFPNKGDTFREVESLLSTGDTTAQKLASGLWGYWARHHDGANKIVSERLLLGKNPEKDAILRAVVSQTYAVHDDLEFVQQLLDHPHTSNLPVIAFDRNDRGLRVRLLDASMERLADMPERGTPHPERRGKDRERVRGMESGTKVPFLDAWNSEVGTRSTGIEGGILECRCTNGLYALTSAGRWAWRHVGNGERIAQGVEQALNSIRAEASGVLRAYDEAVTVAIDDVALFVERELLGFGVTRATTKQVIEALDAPVVDPRRLLTAGIDAITWVAQNEADVFKARDLELVGAKLLYRGLDLARQGDGSIHARPLAEA